VRLGWAGDALGFERSIEALADLVDLDLVALLRVKVTGLVVEQ
jgi:hypothetical protein